MKSKKTVTIENVEYTICSIPIDQSPYLKLINDILTSTPSTKEDADKKQETLEYAIQKILEATVDKKVAKEHQSIIYNLVIELHNIIAKDAEEQAKLFRDQPDTTH